MARRQYRGTRNTSTSIWCEKSSRLASTAQTGSYGTQLQQSKFTGQSLIDHLYAEPALAPTPSSPLVHSSSASTATASPSYRC
jgi:hypothetical protein